MTHALARLYQRIVLGHPIGVLVALSLWLIFFAYHAKDFKLDASSDSILLEDDKDLELYRKIASRYDIKDFLFVTFTSHADLFSPESLKQLRKLRDEIKRLDRVDSVVSLLDIPLLEISGAKLSEITGDSIKTLEDPAVDTKKARKEVLESPVFRDLILSAEGQTTGLLVNLKTDHFFSEISKRKNELLEKQRSEELSQAEQAELTKYIAEHEPEGKRNEYAYGVS